MARPALSFGQLRQLLFDLGFTETVAPKEFIGFRHEETDTDIFLPIYKPHQRVAPHHLMMSRVQLDGKGILDADEFDRRVASASVKHSAS